MYFTFSTQSLGDGSNARYVVYFEKQIVAEFPINDPASPDARQYVERFVDTMNGYYMRRKSELLDGKPESAPAKAALRKRSWSYDHV